MTESPDGRDGVHEVCYLCFETKPFRTCAESLRPSRHASGARCELSVACPGASVSSERLESGERTHRRTGSRNRWICSHYQRCAHRLGFYFLFAKKMEAYEVPRSGTTFAAG